MRAGCTAVKCNGLEDNRSTFSRTSRFDKDNVDKNENDARVCTKCAHKGCALGMRISPKELFMWWVVVLALAIWQSATAMSKANASGKHNRRRYRYCRSATDIEEMINAQTRNTMIQGLWFV